MIPWMTNTFPKLWLLFPLWIENEHMLSERTLGKLSLLLLEGWVTWHTLEHESAPFHNLGNLWSSKKKVQNWLKHTSMNAQANSPQLYILYFASWFSQHVKSLFPRDLFGTSKPCLVTYTWTFEPYGKIWTGSSLSCHRMPRGELSAPALQADSHGFLPILVVWCASLWWVRAIREALVPWKLVFFCFFFPQSCNS